MNPTHPPTHSKPPSEGIRFSTGPYFNNLLELGETFGHPLVERQQSGYRLTPLGETMLPFAEHVATAALTLEQYNADRVRAKSGTLRLACPESIAVRMSRSGLLERFHKRNPGLSIEFVMSDTYVDLSKGEADVAMRSGDTDDGALVGRKIADSIWAVYASRSYVAKFGTPASIEDLAARPLISLNETFSQHRVSRWFHSIAPDVTFVARSHSVLGLVSATKSGIGIAPLPIPLGDAEPDLVRVLGPIPELMRAWRVLCHPDQRYAPRVIAFLEFVQNEIDDLRPMLTG